MNQTADDIIGKYNAWLYKTAGYLVGFGSPYLEDLVQEGRIAMWRALDSFNGSKGSQPAWVTTKAKLHMIDVVTTRRWTGTPPRLHGRNPHQEPRAISLDAERGDGVNLADLAGYYPPELAAADMAYHQEDINAAIMALPEAQRRYVIARFYLAMTTPEMIKAGYFGYDPSALWNSQKNGARNKLRKSLDYLSEEGS